jgi:hypothetical protein
MPVLTAVFRTPLADGELRIEHEMTGVGTSTDTNGDVTAVFGRIDGMRTPMRLETADWEIALDGRAVLAAPSRRVLIVHGSHDARVFDASGPGPLWLACREILRGRVTQGRYMTAEDVPPLEPARMDAAALSMLADSVRLAEVRRVADHGARVQWAARANEAATTAAELLAETRPTLVTARARPGMLAIWGFLREDDRGDRVELTELIAVREAEVA